MTTGNWVENDRVIGVVSEEAVAQGMLASAAGSYIDRHAAE
jgi:hypothetical protein